MPTLPLALLFACADPEPRGQGGPPTYGEDDLTAEQWIDPDVTCVGDADCLSGEVCTDGFCQVDRCDEEYSSVPPLGEDFVFLVDREVAVADANTYEGDYYIDGYDNSDSGVDYAHSWNAGGEILADITGGDFVDAKVETYAAAIEDERRVQVFESGAHPASSLKLSFKPIALDAGDLDADGMAEIVVIGEDELSICDVDEGTCTDLEPPSGDLIDVAVGDVDGDILPEIVLLMDHSSERVLYVLNLDYERTVQVAEFSVIVDDEDSERVAAGDLDGDLKDEIVVLVDGGYGGAIDDDLHTYSVNATWDDAEIELVDDVDANYGRLVDIAVGDMDGDNQAEVMAASALSAIAGYRLRSGHLDEVFYESLDITADSKFIAMADQDDNSVRAVLESGPELGPGAVVPTTLLILPPYVDGAEGNFWAWTGVGESESTSESWSDTTSMSASVHWGSTGNFFNLFGYEKNKKLTGFLQETNINASSVEVGSRWQIRSAPELFGRNTGGVVLSWGCFHTWTYTVHDPDSLLPGSDGEPVLLAVPVDGGTALWSTPRYNALAAAVGGPKVEIPYEVGRPETYPTSPEDIDGKALDEDDLLFTDTTWFEASDIGLVDWFSTVGESTTNEKVIGYSKSTDASVLVGTGYVGIGYDKGASKGYALSVGEKATFYGGIPPIVNDPETPEDEYAEHRFRVSPLTYLDTWTGDDGEDNPIYVNTYVVK